MVWKSAGANANGALYFWGPRTPYGPPHQQYGGNVGPSGPASPASQGVSTSPHSG